MKLKDSDMRTTRELNAIFREKNKFKLDIIIILIIVISAGIIFSRIMYKLEERNNNIPQSQHLQERLKEEEQEK